MGSWICDTCKKPVPDVYQRGERRLEYRMTKSQKRYATITVGYLCKTCMDEEIAQYRPSRKPDPNQGSLL